MTRGGRGSFLDFVRKQETATAAMASIEDAAEYGERADALVSGVLGRVLRQRRSIAAEIRLSIAMRSLSASTPIVPLGDVDRTAENAHRSRMYGDS